MGGDSSSCCSGKPTSARGLCSRGMGGHQSDPGLAIILAPGRANEEFSTETLLWTPVGQSQTQPNAEGALPRGGSQPSVLPSRGHCVSLWKHSPSALPPSISISVILILKCWIVSGSQLIAVAFNSLPSFIHLQEGRHSWGNWVLLGQAFPTGFEECELED